MHCARHAVNIIITIIVMSLAAAAAAAATRTPICSTRSRHSLDNDVWASSWALCLAFVRRQQQPRPRRRLFIAHVKLKQRAHKMKMLTCCWRNCAPLVVRARARALINARSRKKQCACTHKQKPAAPTSFSMFARAYIIQASITTNKLKFVIQSAGHKGDEASWPAQRPAARTIVMILL